jgi:predicted GNAT family acetyltransferase
VTIRVRDNPVRSRYEIYDDEQLAGFCVYRLTGTTIAFTHTQVDPGYSGRGLARRLVTEELDDARRRNLAVQPYCPYVRKVISENTATYLELVPARDRARFDLPTEPAGAPTQGRPSNVHR